MKILQIEYCYSLEYANDFLKQFDCSETSNLHRITYIPTANARVDDNKGQMQSDVCIAIEYWKEAK